MAILDFPAAPTMGQVVTLTNGFSYQWDGAVWTLTPASPGQAAGGDLTGTYPNPTIAAGAVTGAKLGPDSVDGYKLTGAAAARVARTSGAGGNLNTGVFTPIIFTNIDTGTHAADFWTPAAPDRFVIPKAGFHLIGGAAEIGPVSTGTRLLLALLADGGSEYARAECPIIAGVSSARSPMVATVAPLVAGQYMQLCTWHDAGVVLGFTAVYPTFWIVRLG
jgi:hypothetical protein